MAATDKTLSEHPLRMKNCLHLLDPTDTRDKVIRRLERELQQARRIVSFQRVIIQKLRKLI